jgi:acetyl esterase/lipase
MKRERISIRARIMRRLSRRYFANIDAQMADPVHLRHRLERLTRRFPKPKGVAISQATIADVPSMSLTPRNASDTGLLLYLHGGAYVMGSPVTHRNLVSNIAARTGLRALLPDYRLAPEHRFPAAVEDATGVYKALLADGHRPQNIIVAGDSAGGGLTMGMLLSLRDEGVPLPAGAFLLSPWLDLTASGESMETRRHLDPWFCKEDVAFVAHYYSDADQLTHPQVSPVFGDMRGMPPICIQVGDHEVLLSDSTRLADNVRAAGGEVDTEVFDQMWHVFQVFHPVMPESRAAISTLAAKMRKVLSEA